MYESALRVRTANDTWLVLLGWSVFERLTSRSLCCDLGLVPCTRALCFPSDRSVSLSFVRGCKVATASLQRRESSGPAKRSRIRRAPHRVAFGPTVRVRAHAVASSSVSPAEAMHVSLQPLLWHRGAQRPVGTRGTGLPAANRVRVWVRRNSPGGSSSLHTGARGASAKSPHTNRKREHASADPMPTMWKRGASVRRTLWPSFCSHRDSSPASRDGGRNAETATMDSFGWGWQSAWCVAARFPPRRLCRRSSLRT